MVTTACPFLAEHDTDCELGFAAVKAPAHAPSYFCLMAMTTWSSFSKSWRIKSVSNVRRLRRALATHTLRHVFIVVRVPPRKQQAQAYRPLHPSPSQRNRHGTAEHWRSRKRLHSRRTCTAALKRGHHPSIHHPRARQHRWLHG